MDWLVALAGAMTVMLLVWMTTVLTVLWALRRSNRVDPSVRGTAPLTWLVSPGSAARLHRRVRGAVQLARRVGRGSAGQQRELVSELSRQAVALDHELVVASAFPRPHRRQPDQEHDGHRPGQRHQPVHGHHPTAEPAASAVGSGRWAD